MSLIVVDADRALHRKQGWTVGIALISTFVIYADIAIVNIAAPVIERDLGAGVTDLELMVAGYQIAFAAILITGGRLADILGCRTMFAGSFAAFVLASAACGLAATPGQLIAFRILQGVAAAALSPQVVAIIQVVLPPERRSAAFSALGMVISVGSTAGPLIAGFLVSADLFGSGWRPIFLINVPIGLVAIAFGLRLVPGYTGEEAKRIDYTGAVLLMALMVALMTPLTLGPFDGWPAWTWASFAAVPVLGAVFLWSQRRLGASGRDPMLPPELWRDHAFRMGLVLYALTFSGVIAFFLYLGITLQNGLGISPLWQAVTTTPFAVSLAAFSAYSGVAVRRLGGAKTLAIGCLVAGLGFLTMILPVAVVGDRSMVLWTIPSQIVAGGGLGLVVAPLLGVVLAQIRSSAAGAASGLLGTAQVIGGALGVGLMGLLFQTQLPGGLAEATSGDLRAGLALSLLVNPVAFALSAWIVTRNLGPVREEQP
ncbi:MFS transporter [Streptosporangiaceae bacterium NEAU-GS5]|nr:MFS transporter [Streptosporangiaceae bacterium NEAU-GS5]